MNFLASILFLLSAGALGELDFSNIQLDLFDSVVTEAPPKDTTVDTVGGLFSGIILDPPVGLTTAVVPSDTTEAASPGFDFSGIQLDPLFDVPDSTSGVPEATTTAVGWFSGIELDPFDEPVISTMQTTTATVVSGGVHASSDSHGLATTLPIVQTSTYPAGQESSTTTSSHNALVSGASSDASSPVTYHTGWFIAILMVGIVAVLLGSVQVCLAVKLLYIARPSPGLDLELGEGSITKTSVPKAETVERAEMGC